MTQLNCQDMCSGVNLDEHLIAHFSLDGDAREQLGSGFDGSIYGAVPTAGQGGDSNSAFLFDGVNDYIHVGNHFNLGESNFTIACKVKVHKFKDLISGTNSRGGWIVNKGVTIYGAPSRAGYALDARKLNGQNYFYFFVGGQHDYIYNANGFGFEEDRWYSLIGIKDKDSISLFVDNELIATSLIPSDLNVNTNIPLVFGSIDKLGNDAVGTTFFDGIIDDVRIYNRVLSFDERRCLSSGCPPPVVSLGEDKVRCMGSSVVLGGSDADLNYLWSNGSTTPIIEVTESGTYWLEATNTCGSARDTVSVEFDEIPVIELGEDRKVCMGTEVILRTGVLDASYIWSNGSTTPDLSITESGTYWLEATNACGSARDTVSVEFDEMPVIELGEDRKVCMGSEVILRTGVLDASYIWSNGSTMPDLSITESGTYWVEVENSCGVVRDTIELEFIQLLDLSVSNIFTPNGDGINEHFEVDSRLLGSNLRVFQRSGKKVYESSNYRNDWDGGNLSSGVYYWLITDDCGNSFKGWVTILY